MYLSLDYMTSILLKDNSGSGLLKSYVHFYR